MIFAAQHYGFRNIAEYDGLGISITGISIVFVALILISLFIATLPRILALLESILPPEAELHRAAAPATKSPESDEAVVVALGFALHDRHRKRQ